MLARALAVLSSSLVAAGCGQPISQWEPKIASLSPGVVEAGGSTQLSFTVDRAPTYGADLRVELSPPTSGTVPATVHLGGGQAQGTFTFTGNTAWAEGTVSLSAGSTATAPVLVARGLVISELAPAGPLGAYDEFVELYNPTSQEIQLVGYVLEYSSLSNPTVFNAWHTFEAGAAIASHGFYVVGNSVSPVKDVASNGILMSATGGAIRLQQGATTVDQLGWGGGNSEGSSVPAPGAPGSLERKARSSSSIASMSSGADQLLGNAYDLDDNATDFVARPTREPQTAASGAREPGRGAPASEVPRGNPSGPRVSEGRSPRNLAKRRAA